MSDNKPGAATAGHYAMCTQGHRNARLVPDPPQAASAGALTFEEFSRINRQRCESKEGFNHTLSSWSTSDWFTALMGELGEAANIAKKLNRVRDGIPGNKTSKEELKAKLRQELGDVFVYLDLLAQSEGFFIGNAATEVFNAKSQELNCPILITQLAAHDQKVRAEATLAEHKSHVDFENELYATLVDPVAEGSIKEAEMREKLLESARWYRQRVYDLENKKP